MRFNLAASALLGVLCTAGCDTGSRDPAPKPSSSTPGGTSGGGGVTGTAPPGGGTTAPGVTPGGTTGGTTTGAGGTVGTGPSAPGQFQLDPSVTRPQNIWHLDFDSLQGVFARNSIGHGLGVASEPLDSPINRLPRDKVTARVLERVNTAYLRDPDGTGRSSQSLHITFTALTPDPARFPDGPGRDYSRICIASTSSRCGSGTLGVETLDYGNRRAESACRLDQLGTFAGRICGLNSELGQTFRSGPPLTLADLRFVDGSYTLGSGSSADDDRFREIDEVISDWATAIGNVLAHEVGHSVGLDHSRSGIMIATTNARDMSDPTQQFEQSSINTLAQNLGVQP